MEHSQKNKEELLNTPMNQLGLGGAFGGWFFKPKYMTQEQVITLKEFFSLNQTMKANKDSFVCWGNEEIKSNFLHCGFIKESNSWKKLEKFLIGNGFTHKDLIMLLPSIKTGKGNVPDYKLLDKKVLVKMPVCKVTDIKASCSPIQYISRAILTSLYKEDPYQLLLEDVLAFTPAEIEFEFPDNERNRTERNTLLSIQNKLKGFGFTEKDGPFMKASLIPTKSKVAYIDHLVKNKNFSQKDAETAVQLGLRAGWIQV